jgi:DmsE family decaheme c-type cytochrome
MTARHLVLALTAILAGGLIAADEPIPMADCAVCHEDIAPAFAGGAHGRAMAAVSKAMLERSCATCHGASLDHIDDPSPDNVVRVPGPEGCVGCHPDAASKIDLMTPAHNRHSVACLDCHASGHEPTGTDHLLLDAQPALCARCHLGEAAAFKLPFAHRDGQLPFECAACHSVHGDSRQGRLNLLRDGGACVECHTEKARPFVFQHPPVDRHGCARCHEPHGSTNPRQLTRRSITMLCLECHADVPSFHDLGRPKYRQCQTCHAAVHGSNRDPRLIEE